MSADSLRALEGEARAITVAMSGGYHFEAAFGPP